MVTREEHLILFRMLRDRLSHVDAVQRPTGAKLPRLGMKVAMLSHAKWMVEDVLSDLERNAPATRAERWLGFVSGVLWVAGDLNLDELRQCQTAAFYQSFVEAMQEIGHV